MKKVLQILTIVFLSSVSLTQAQSTRNCGTMQHLDMLKQQDPGLEARMDAIEQQTQQYIAANPNARMQTIVTIPVIVHVIYANATQNISDDLVKSQIDVLNEDYGAYNSDVAKVPPFFKGRVVDSQIRFALATRDPNGNATNGISRVSTTVASFSQNNGVKYTAQGGENAWPAASYLNIWVCNLGGGLLGYAQFPGGAAATDGVVILYSSFGRISAGSPYHYGRTTTHEVGHWLNLRHINGDANCGNDQVSDTPTQAALNFGTFTCANITCSNGPTGDMIMNYMDYTDDRYMYMFSQGQVTRMAACMASTRSSLASSQGITNPSPASIDAGILDVVNPRLVIASAANNNFIPEVVLKNYGTSTLTSCNIVYKVDAGTAATFNWTGSLASGATTNVILPMVTQAAGAGDHIFYCNTASPNGGTDGLTINDKLQINFITKVANQNLPLVQNFDGTFPPTGWSNKNYTCGNTFAKSTTAHYAGTGSVWFNNFTNTISGKINDLYTAPLNLTSMANPQISFWVSHAQRSANFTDTLEVLISTNGGLSYTSLYKKWGSALATVPMQATAFTPATTADWRQETINLSAWSTAQDAFIIFRNTSKNGNNIFIDELNFATGVSKIDNLNNFSIYPNPSGGVINFNATFSNSENITLRIVNMLGEVVYVEKLSGVQIEKQINLESLAAGVYNVMMQTSQGTVNRKITLEK